MKDQQEIYAQRHKFCVTLDACLADLRRSPEVQSIWYENERWYYRYRGGIATHEVIAVCEHPEDPVCTVNPSLNTVNDKPVNSARTMVDEVLNKLLNE